MSENKNGITHMCTTHGCYTEIPDYSYFCPRCADEILALEKKTEREKRAEVVTPEFVILVLFLTVVLTGIPAVIWQLIR